MKPSVALFSLLAVLAFGAVGCQNKSTEADPKADTSGTATSSPEAEPTTPFAVDELPEEVKHDAYEYMGLGNSEELKYEFVQDGQSSEGTQKSTTYTKKSDGEYVFMTERTGGLAVMMADRLLVNKDGAFTTYTLGKELEKPLMAMPATVSPGEKWTIAYTLDSENGPVTVDIENTIVGTTKVTTPAGSYECIHLKAAGDSTVGGVSTKVEGDTYYAKGIGVVKMSLNLVSPEKTQKISLQLVPTDTPQR